MIAVTSVIINIAAITMIVVGVLNLPEVAVLKGCPSAPGMPMFNITGGSIIMLGLFVREILKRFCECCNGCFDNDKCCRIGGKLLKCGTTLIYDLVFMFIATVWLIAGTASVIDTYKKYLGEDITMAFGSLKETSDNIVNTINLKAVSDNINESSQKQKELDGLVECDEVLYNLTLVVLVAGWIILAIAVLFVLFCKICYNVLCCKPCKDDRQQHEMYAV